MPVPGQPGKVQGFRLEEGGKASSINMATLVYEGWKRDGDVLTVSGKSVGNRQTIPFTENFRIVKLSRIGYAKGNVDALQKKIPSKAHGLRGAAGCSDVNALQKKTPSKGLLLEKAKDGTILFRYKKS